MGELSIRVKIADRTYPMTVDAELEVLIRDAAKQIQERLKWYRAEREITDTQDAMTMIAMDCLIEKLGEERRVQRLQQMVFDKITQLDQVVTT